MEVEPTAIVRDLGPLADVLARRRKALGMSQLELDERTGLQVGYVGKLEAWRTPKYGRKLGNVSLPLMLEALGLALLLVRTRRVSRPKLEEPEQLCFELKGGRVNRPALAVHAKPIEGCGE